MKAFLWVFALFLVAAYASCDTANLLTCLTDVQTCQSAAEDEDELDWNTRCDCLNNMCLEDCTRDDLTTELAETWDYIFDVCENSWACLEHFGGCEETANTCYLDLGANPAWLDACECWWEGQDCLPKFDDSQDICHMPLGSILVSGTDCTEFRDVAWTMYQDRESDIETWWADHTDAVDIVIDTTVSAGFIKTMAITDKTSDTTEGTVTGLCDEFVMWIDEVIDEECDGRGVCDDFQAHCDIEPVAKRAGAYTGRLSFYRAAGTGLAASLSLLLAGVFALVA
jgi:hypothetical protein